MKEKKFLVVVDMQKDFIDGSLGTQEAQEMTPDAVKRIRECKAEGYTLIATLDTHEENYMDTAEGKKLPVPHCIRGTAGWKLDGRVREALGECVLVIEGTSFDALQKEEQKSWEEISIEDHVRMYEEQGNSRKEAMRLAARDRGVSRREIYEFLLNIT